MNRVAARPEATKQFASGRGDPGKTSINPLGVVLLLLFAKRKDRVDPFTLPAYRLTPVRRSCRRRLRWEIARAWRLGRDWSRRLCSSPPSFPLRGCELISSLHLCVMHDDLEELPRINTSLHTHHNRDSLFQLSPFDRPVAIPPLIQSSPMGSAGCSTCITWAQLGRPTHPTPA